MMTRLTTLVSTIVALGTMTLMCTSCMTVKDEVSYFQDAFEVPDSLWSKTYDAVPRMRPNDEISIIVSSADQTAAAAFNKTPFSRLSQQSTELSTLATLQSYRINERGEIEMPVLGVIRLRDMTALEAQDMLTERLKQYLKDPLVTVSILSMTATVLGEVNAPGSFYFSGDRATILEALGSRGDLTVYGRRDNVMLLREKDGKREVHKIDLTSAECINSPYYYLQQDDVIYVSPNSSKRDSSRYNNLKSYNISLIGTIVSCVSVLATLAVAIWK